jgi:hypothetical protein
MPPIKTMQKLLTPEIIDKAAICSSTTKLPDRFPISTLSSQIKLNVKVLNSTIFASQRSENIQ